MMAGRTKRTGKGLADTGTYAVTLCGQGHIHVDLHHPDAPKAHFALAPDDAYEFAQAILRCYDKAAGIA